MRAQIRGARHLLLFVLFGVVANRAFGQATGHARHTERRPRHTERRRWDTMIDGIDVWAPCGGVDVSRGIDDSPLLFGFRGNKGASMSIDEVNVEVLEGVLGRGDVRGECGSVLLAWSVLTEDEGQFAAAMCHCHLTSWGVVFLHRYPARGKSGFVGRCIIAAPNDQRSPIKATSTS